MKQRHAKNPNILNFRSKLLVAVMIFSFCVSPFVITGIAGTDHVKLGALNTKKKDIFIKHQKGLLTIVQPIQYLVGKVDKPIEVKKPSDQIMGMGQIDLRVLSMFLCGNNPRVNQTEALALAKIYVEEANAEGVNYDIAFSQMCLETGFLKFNGDVDPSQNNYCGLGVTGGGVPGLSFDDTQTGVRAHIQHLKAYASKQQLKSKLVDARFHYVKRGSVRVVDELTGKWATDKHYGFKINHLLQRLYDYEQRQL